MEKKYLLIIKADTNDADYIESSNYIDESDLQVIMKVAKAIKSVSGERGIFNWYTLDGREVTPRFLYKDLLTKDDIDLFEVYIPYGELGIHTIESIRALEILKDEELL